MPTGRGGGTFGGCPAVENHRESAEVYAAKGVIQSSNGTTCYTIRYDTVLSISDHPAAASSCAQKLTRWPA